MRILVVGQSGQLAQALIRTAVDGIAVVSVGRPDVRLECRTSLAAALAAHRPNAVINAAAYTAVDKAESERELAFAVNAEGAGNIAAATAAVGVPLIHVSTDYVFDGTKPAPYVEDDPTGPLGVYGASKLDGERTVAAANPRHVIVRTSWVISEFGTNFVKTMLRLAKERDQLRVVGDQHGAPTYAPDLAVALLEIARQVANLPADDERFGIYHLTNGGATTWAGLAQAVVAASACFGGRVVPVHAITTAEYPTPARRPGNSRLDCSRIRTVFGISLPPWQDAIERCVAKVMAMP